MDFDLDAITGKKRYIKYLGRKIEIKDLTVKEYLNAAALLEDMPSIESSNDYKKSIHEIQSKITEYITSVLDISQEEANKISFRQFRAIKDYLSILDLTDQGFSEKEAKNMIADAVKKRIG